MPFLFSFSLIVLRWSLLLYRNVSSPKSYQLPPGKTSPILLPSRWSAARPSGFFPDLYAFECRGWEGEPLLARVFIWRSDLRQNGMTSWHVERCSEPAFDAHSFREELGEFGRCICFVQGGIH